MEVDSVRIIAILSMSDITTRIIKTWTSVAKIPRVAVENEITILSVVKIAIKFSPCTFAVSTKKNSSKNNIEISRSYTMIIQENSCS